MKVIKTQLQSKQDTGKIWPQGFWPCRQLSHASFPHSLVPKWTISCRFPSTDGGNILSWRWLHATMASTFSTSQLPKAVRKWGAFSFLTWKCASRHTASLFDISTSKSGPNVSAFSFLTWKCASRHNGVTFSTSQLPKAVRTWGAFSFLTWKCASRHNGVHFCDISTSKAVRTWGDF